MNKACYLFLFLFFCSLTIPVRGQKALDETIKKSVLLEKEIESLKKDSAKVEDRIKDVLLLIEKDSLKNKELNTRHNVLLSSLSQDSISVLEQYVDSLEKRHKALQTAITSIKKEISAKNVELRNADSELKDMNVYSELQKQQTYKNNKLYLSQKYSKMSLEKLTKISNDKNEYKLFEGFTDYEKRIAAALNNKKLYDKAWVCVSTGNDYQKVDEFRSGINILLEIKSDDSIRGIYKLTKEQFNEMDSLDIKLSRCNNGIKELQNIVRRINSDEQIVQFRNDRKSGSKKDCIELMKQYVNHKEGTEGARIYERYFKMIPFLEKLLRRYWNELNTNPFDTPTKTERIITGLEIK